MLVAFVAAAVMASSGLTAIAHTESTLDSNDVRGLLDIKSMTVSHKGEDIMVHALETFSDWSPRDLGSTSYFVFILDTGGTRGSFERCAFIYQTRGNLRGALTNCGKKYLTGLKVIKLAANSVEVRIETDRLGGIDSYRYGVESFYEGTGCPSRCVDAAPDDFPLPFQDIRRPTITVQAPIPSDVRTTPDIQVDYSVSDVGGSGLASWALDWSEMGTGVWEPIASGSSPVVSTFDPGELPEGSTFAFHGTASDGQGNVAEKTRYVAIPIDDGSFALSDYSGTWITSTPADSYLATLSTGMGDSATDAVFTATLPCPEGYRCRLIWIAPGYGEWDGLVTVRWAPPSIAGDISQVHSSDIEDLPRQRVFTSVARAGEWPSYEATVTIKAIKPSYTVPIDALAWLVTPKVP